MLKKKFIKILRKARAKRKTIISYISVTTLLFLFIGTAFLITNTISLNLAKSIYRSNVSVASNKDIYLANENPVIKLDDKLINAKRLSSVLGASTNIIEDKNSITVINSLNQKVKGIKIIERSEGVYELDLKSKVGFRPGKYTLEINYYGQVIKKDFTWGVLAVNTSKSVYKKGNTAYIQIASLDETGHTLCNSNLDLNVKPPDSEWKKIDVSKSGKCKGNNVVDIPDYFAHLKLEKTGEYKIKLTNKDKNYTIEDSFNVENSPAFEIERIAPTRIYPFADYKVTLRIKANKNYKGKITEKLPATFKITDRDSKINGTLLETSWDIELKKGEYEELTYTFDAPNISPELYTIVPMTISNFTEARGWQIASDAVQTAREFFTTTGSWTTPPGVTSLDVEAWGGGGAGGGRTSTGTSGGGGGGAYAKTTISVTPETSYNFTVGAQVNGTTGNGATGNDSLWGDGSLLRAKGGSGGTNNVTGGAGGQASASVGDTKYTGGSGGNGAGTSGGGGGGGAGSTGNGNGGTAGSPGGLTNDYGGTGGNPGNNANGGIGGLYGAGGGGVYRSTSSRSGGAGSAGLIGVSYSAEFPKVEQISQGSQNTNSTSHTITMPSTINAGELLIIIFSVDGAPTASISSGGWTKLDQASNSTVVTQAIFYKVAEGGDTATVSTTASEQSTHFVYRISGSSGVVTATSANGSSTNSNPPNHDSGSTDFKLWLATRGGDSTTVASAIPLGFANHQILNASSTGGASTNVAEYLAYTQSHDPTTWTSTSEQWVSYTLAIEPMGAQTVSGTAFSDVGENTLGAGKTINLRINGEGSYTTETDSFGDWEISTEGLSEGDIITVYLDDETEKATTVILSNGEDLDTVHLYQNTVVVRTYDQQVITQDELYIGDDSDSDIKYNVSASTNGNIILDSGVTLIIWPQSYLRVSGGNLTTQGGGDVWIGEGGGFLELTTNTNTIAGDLIIDYGSGILINGNTTIQGGNITVSGNSEGGTTDGTSVVTMNGSGSISIDPTSYFILHELNISSGVTTTLETDILIESSVITTGSGNLVTTGTATLTMLETGTLGGGSGTLQLYNLVLGNETTNSTTLASNLSVANLQVNASHTFDMADFNVTVGSPSINGSGNITNNGGITENGTATLTLLSGTTPSVITGVGTFATHNLTIGNGTDEVSVGTDEFYEEILVNGDFVIASNSTYENWGQSSIQIKGNYSNLGSYIANNGTLYFTGTGEHTLEGSLTGDNSLYNVFFESTTGDWEFIDNATVLNDFIISDAQSVEAPLILEVGGDFLGGSEFIAGSGTVNLNRSTGAWQSVYGGPNFYNLVVTTELTRGIEFEAGATVTINNNLTLNGGSCHQLLILRSGQSNTPWYLDDNSGGTTDVIYVDVQDSIATDQAINAPSSSNSGGNTGWTIPASACVGGGFDDVSTASSFQRKTFYDETNERYWIFFFDGSGIEARYSTNNGSTWNRTATSSNSSLPYNTYDFSVWNTKVGETEYVLMAISNESDIILLFGELSVNDIVWEDSITIYSGDNDQVLNYNPYITTDSENYIWISWAAKEGPDIYYAQGRTNDPFDPESENDYGMSNLDGIASSTSQTIYGTNIPLDNQNMYTAFVVGNELRGCYWNNTAVEWQDSEENTCGSSNYENWYDGNWSNRDIFTVEDNLLTTGSLSYYSVLINLTREELRTTANGGGVGKSNGGDILFTLEDGVTKVNHQIEQYDPTTGKIVAWVEIPTITYAERNNMYIYYGNASASDQWNNANTWSENGANNFKGIWHLAESGNGTSNEFLNPLGSLHGTGGGGNSAKTPTQDTDGKIGNAQEFDGINDYISVGHHSSISAGSSITVEGWFKMPDGFDIDVERNQTIVDKGDYKFYLDRTDGKAKWAVNDNTAKAFSAMGTGVDGRVWAMAVWNGDLYVGGIFGSASGVSNTSRIARWDGSNWHALGTGTNHDVYILQEWNGDLYVGGNFTSAGGVSNTNYIARWDGSNWHALGIGTEEEVWVLTPWNGSLIVGGVFADAGGVSNTANIARWDGSSWHSIATGGANGAIYAAEIWNDELYAGGIFTTIGGTSASNIAKYDGSTWSALGSGTNGDVYTMAVYNGELYVGGMYTTAGGGSAANIAKWDGSNWSALGTGASSMVETMLVWNGELWVGGEFSSAGGVSSTNRIAKWNGSSWVSPGSVGQITGSDINVMHTWKGHLYVGGNFTTANSITVNRVTRLGTSNSLVAESTTNSWNADTWYHFAAQYDGSALKLYINGELEGNESSTVTIQSNSRALFIGNSYGGMSKGNANESFKGSIDEVRISGAVRSSNWIDTSYRLQDTPNTYTFISGEEGGGSYDLIATIPTDDYYNLTRNISTTVDSNYDLHISYIKEGTPNQLVHRKRDNTTKEFGSETLVPNSASNNHIFTSISLDRSTEDQDDLYVTWIDNSNNYLYLNRYDESETSWDGETLLSNTHNYQYGTLNHDGDGRISITATVKSGDFSTVYWESIKAPESGGSPPVVSSVVVNGGDTIILTEGTTTEVSITATVTDPDGHADISTAIGKLYRSGVSGAHECSANQSNCYEISSCALTSCAGNSCTATCTANVTFFADPTDEGSPFSSQYWRGWVQAEDESSNIGEEFSSTSSPDIASMSALEISSAISYGPLLPGDDTGSSPKMTTITNTGNTTIDTEISGDDLCSNYPTCTGPQIGVGYQEYSSSTFTYGVGTGLTSTPATLSVSLPKSTALPSNSSTTIYWGLGIPIPKEVGSYTGQNVVSAINAD